MARHVHTFSPEFSTKWTKVIVPDKDETGYTINLLTWLSDESRAGTYGADMVRGETMWSKSHIAVWCSDPNTAFELKMTWG